MLPRLSPGPAPAGQTRAFLDRLRRNGFAGDLESSGAERLAGATDNSIYEVMPEAILYPRTTADVSAILRLAGEAPFSTLTFLPRGGATGTNGQSLGTGIVIDLSRHMNAILAIDPERRRVRVEAGAVKDRINDRLRPFGLHFPPELSTSNRATIGGMVNTDASGQGSRIYGKTHDYVRSVTAVLAGGEVFEARSRGQDPDVSPRLAAMISALNTLAGDNAGLIAEKFPKLPRQATGYDLANLRAADGGIDLVAVICGSEGTLAVVTEAELEVAPLPAHAMLIVLAYADFVVALRDAHHLAGEEIASIESIDETVLDLARGDPLWPRLSSYFDIPGDDEPFAANIVEITAASLAELEEKRRRFGERLAGSLRVRHSRDVPEDDVGAVWDLRKRAVGMLGRLPGLHKPVAFVEDTIVPRENLAAYIEEFRSLLIARGYAFGMFGHADAGVIHVRPAIDPLDPTLAERVKSITDEVFRLTQKHGGALWGEHGKGFRSAYAPAFFGPLYPLMQQVKAAFDPGNRLNPGKVAGPSLIPLDAPPTRARRTGPLSPWTRELYRGAVECNGNAACLDSDPDSPMCPSWKATRDRRQSPKGRASLLRGWLSMLAAMGIDPVTASAGLAQRRLDQRLAALLARTWHTLGRAFGRQDFSTEVREALDTCLACGACGGQCPVRVDIPDLRSRFLELYHDRYLRPLFVHFVVSLERLAPALSRFAPLYNAAASLSPVRWLMTRLGLVHLPRVSRSRRQLDAILSHNGVELADGAVLARLDAAERARSIVLVLDALTEVFDSDVLVAVLAVLRSLGVRVWRAPRHANGKALLVNGMRAAYRRVATRNATALSSLAAAGIPLVGIEPSLTISYRTDYRREIPPADFRVELLSEWLSANLDRWPAAPPGEGAPIGIMLHCAEHSLAAASRGDWPRILEHFGIPCRLVDTGCCGMSGGFGHEARNRALSDRIFALSWGRKMKDGNGELAATGYSCRSQVRIATGRPLRHPAEVLAEALARRS